MSNNTPSGNLPIARPYIPSGIPIPPALHRVMPNQPIFQSQAVAPPPGQTYYQVVVDRAGVTLRDWPKLRYSQAMAKQTVHPGSVTIPLNEFLNDELSEKVHEIFGDPVYNNLLEAIKEAQKPPAGAKPQGQSH